MSTPFWTRLAAAEALAPPASGGRPNPEGGAIGAGERLRLASAAAFRSVRSRTTSVNVRNRRQR